MLLHGGKGDDVIKSFFNEVYGYYVKVCHVIVNNCFGIINDSVWFD